MTQKAWGGSGHLWNRKKKILLMIGQRKLAGRWFIEQSRKTRWLVLSALRVFWNHNGPSPSFKRPQPHSMDGKSTNNQSGPRIKYLCSLGLRFQWWQNPLVMTPVSLEQWIAFSLEVKKPARVTKIYFSSELRNFPHIHVHILEWVLGQNSQVHRAGWRKGRRQSLHRFPAQWHLSLCPSCRA